MDAVPPMLVLHHHGVRPTVPQSDATHSEAADVAACLVGVFHQLCLVLAIQLTTSRQHSSPPLPGIFQGEGRTAELGLKSNIVAVDADYITDLQKLWLVTFPRRDVSTDRTCLTTWGTPDTRRRTTSLVASLLSPPTVLIALQVYSP